MASTRSEGEHSADSLHLELLLTNDAVTIFSVNLGGWLVTEPVSQRSVNQ